MKRKKKNKKKKRKTEKQEGRRQKKRMKKNISKNKISKEAKDEQDIKRRRSLKIKTILDVKYFNTAPKSEILVMRKGWLSDEILRIDFMVSGSNQPSAKHSFRIRRVTSSL